MGFLQKLSEGSLGLPWGFFFLIKIVLGSLHPTIESCSFILCELTHVFASESNTGYNLIYFEETKKKRE